MMKHKNCIAIILVLVVVTTVLAGDYTIVVTVSNDELKLIKAFYEQEYGFVPNATQLKAWMVGECDKRIAEVCRKMTQQKYNEDPSPYYSLAASQYE